MRRQGRWLCLLACLLLASFVLVSCSDDDGDDEDDGDGQVQPTTGSLALTVSPTEATVAVSGPDNFTFSDAGQASYTLDELEPGTYTVNVSAPGFVAQRNTARIVAGVTTPLAVALSRVDPTTGSLALTVSPTEATVTVSGPDNFTFSDAGQASYTLDALEPGTYTVDVSAPGFVAQSSTTGVVAGETTPLAFALIPVTGRQAFYIDNDGQLVEIPESALDRPGNFVFYAWLEDRNGGIATDPIAGAPSADEQEEIAPSGTQNLAAAFVGFRIAGNIFPVVNAAVRWEIDRQYGDAVGSLQFGAADDGSNAPGADPAFVSDDQADTFTNNGNVRNMSRFPVSGTSLLYNMTGVETPDTNGFTWVTLFSPDPRATARLVVVASVNGTEIDKQRLIKHFAPVPRLAIRKTVAPSTVILPTGETARVTFTWVVTNEGDGEALNVVLRDRLTTGRLPGYAIDVATLPDDSQPVDQGGDENVEGFNLTIAALPADASRTFTFVAIVRLEDEYCNTIRIDSFATEFETVNVDIPAEACFTVTGPSLAIIKDFVDADENELGDNVTVSADQAARVRVRLINSGTAPANRVRLSEALGEVSGGGNVAAYRISDLPANATPSGTSGFELNIPRIAVDETVTLIFNAQASEDGRYCDTASFDSATAGTGADGACLMVATPELTIVKSNPPTNLTPGNSYRSTITVTNVGTTAVSNVIISDRLGLLNDTTTNFVEHVSSSLAGTAGTFDPGTNTVTFASVNLARAESVRATVMSRIPNTALPGDYCDIARYMSANAGRGDDEACVTVAAFAATQATLADQLDPVRGGEDVVLNGTIFNELRSNESLDTNALVFTVGEGQFDIQRTQLFFDSDPMVDPNTGLVITGPNDADRELEAGTEYTTTAGGTGVETIELAASVQSKSRPGDLY